MKYYKRIRDDSLEKWGIEVDKIYPEDKISWKSTYSSTIDTVKDSVNRYPENWEKSSKKEYLEQEGWCVKGCKKLRNWLLNNASTCWDGDIEHNYYYLSQYGGWTFNTKPKGIEITVDELDEIFNDKQTEKMEHFTVKVTQTTSQILYDLAIENGWEPNFSINNTYKAVNYLIFKQNNILGYTANRHHALNNYTLVSLEKAIELITSEEEKFEEGEWIINDDGILLNVQKETKKGYEGFGFGTSGWSDNSHWSTIKNTKLRRATDKEVKDALIKEAKKRYKVPVKVQYLDSRKDNLRGFELEYDSEFDTLYASVSRDVIYHQGKWAKIVDEPKWIFGHKVEISEDEIYKFGCNHHKYTKDELIRITKTLAEIHGNIKVGELREELYNLVFRP